jgi:hypothetical protein
MKVVKVPSEVFQAMLNKIAERPFAEVHLLIDNVLKNVKEETIEDAE